MIRRVLTVSVAVFIAAASVPAGVAAASPTPSPCVAAPSQCAQQAAELDAIRNQLGADLADTIRIENHLDSSLHLATAEQQQLVKMVGAADQRIAQLNANIDELQIEIDTTSRRIKTERAQIATLARSEYMQPQSMLLLLAESQNLGDALTQSSRFVLAGLNAQRLKQRLVDDLNLQQADETQATRDRDLAQQQRTVVQNLLGRSTMLLGLSNAISEELRLIVDRINTQLATVGSESPGLANEIKLQLGYEISAIATEANQVTSTYLQLALQLPPDVRNQVLEQSASAASSTSTRARLAWPILNAVLTQGFGPSSLAIEPPMMGYAHFHSGIDLAAPFDSPILAAANGVVVIVGYDRWGYGNYIVIDHGGGLATVYAHLNVAGVTRGQVVVQGQVIGREGSTGASTGPHLHLEVRVNGTPVNPLTYLT